jgi:trimethylamine:corrinoid methyltransferase-like protein
MKTENVTWANRLPPHQVLTGEEVDSVRQSSLTVLEEVGILIEHPRALSLLAEAGAAVDFDSHRVKIPAALVEKSARSVPTARAAGDVARLDCGLRQEAAARSHAS